MLDRLGRARVQRLLHRRARTDSPNSDWWMSHGRHRRTFFKLKDTDYTKLFITRLGLRHYSVGQYQVGQFAVLVCAQHTSELDEGSVEHITQSSCGVHSQVIMCIEKV